MSCLGYPQGSGRNDNAPWFNEEMTSGDFDYVKTLRAKGFRVTPQRRAILGVFKGGSAEHLPAEVVHSRAAAVLPEISRGTVYATLAELAEIGLLSSVGSSDPVRYELNTSPHSHFRCLVCARVHDVHIDSPPTHQLASEGFVVQRATVIAEGTCSDCVLYSRGLKEGAKKIRTSPRPFRGWPDEGGLTCAHHTGPLGATVIAATKAGLVRVAFEEHADFGALRDRTRRSGGDRTARMHIESAARKIAGYLDGKDRSVDAQVDWDSLAQLNVEALRATAAIPYGQLRSYTELLPHPAESARGLGRAMGANPLPIVFPCHRVIRGREIPGDYVAGAERREWLLSMERDRSRK